MTARACSHPGCPLQHAWSGYCSAHAAQFKRRGHTWEIGHRPSVTERILARAVPDGDCLVWQGTKMPNGYGQINWNRRKWLVHRAIWTDEKGPIPNSLTIDHLCRRRDCVNTSHMELVTIVENSRRGGGLQVARQQSQSRTHCRHGHEFTDENTRYSRASHRICVTCSRQQWSDWYTRSGRRQGKTIVSPCGTRAAYARHRTRGEDCQRCRRANAAAARARRAGAAVRSDNAGEEEGRRG